MTHRPSVAPHLFALWSFLAGNGTAAMQTCRVTQAWRGGDVTCMHGWSSLHGGERAECRRAHKHCTGQNQHPLRQKDDERSWHSSHGASVLMALLPSPSPALNCVLTHFGSITLLPLVARNERRMACLCAGGKRTRRAPLGGL